jgi:hypothetical protein
VPLRTDQNFFHSCSVSMTFYSWNDLKLFNKRYRANPTSQMKDNDMTITWRKQWRQHVATFLMNRANWMVRSFIEVKSHSNNKLYFVYMHINTNATAWDRENTLNRITDYFHECFKQHLIRRNIKFKPLLKT